MGDVQQQIDALAARVAQLEAERWTGPPRLGPRPETPEDLERRTAALVKAVKAATPEPPPVDRSKLCTTDGRPVAEARAAQASETGMHESYVVLCEDERQRGFVRPYRDRYKHLTCGTVTTMGRALSETYARDPKFYTHTFCVHCNRHPPVEEFVWTADGLPVGS